MLPMHAQLHVAFPLHMGSFAANSSFQDFSFMQERRLTAVAQ